MAVSLLPMSALSHLPQNHMTGAHGQSACSGLPDSPAGVPSPSNSRKPKLSLQTNSLTNTYGSLTRGLGPNSSQTTYTPTTANTLTNTWDLSIRPSPVSRTESPRPLPARSQPLQQPYVVTLPFGVRPILKNSPLPPRQGSVSASPRDGRRKVFFPQPKHVAFRKNLEEVILNTDYTTSHYDLSSSESDASDNEATEETSPDSSATEIESTVGYSSPPPSRKRKNRRDSGVFIGPLEQDDQPTQPQERTTSNAPASRSCKRRKWQWTLVNPQTPKLDSEEASAQSTPVQDDGVEEDAEEGSKEIGKENEAPDQALPNPNSQQPSEDSSDLGCQPNVGSCPDSSGSGGTDPLGQGETLNTNTNR